MEVLLVLAVAVVVVGVWHGLLFPSDGSGEKERRPRVTEGDGRDCKKRRQGLDEVFTGFSTHGTNNRR